jgi:hypothetical protein
MRNGEEEIEVVTSEVTEREKERRGGGPGWRGGSVSDFRGLRRGLPLPAIKTQVMEKSPRAGCILQQ